MKRFILILLPVLLISCVSRKPENVEKRTLESIVQPWEDGLRTDPDGKSFEWWYFDSTFKDGMTVVIVFSTKSILKPSSGKDPQASIVINLPDGRKYSAIDEPKDKRIEASLTRCNVKIGNSHVSADGKGLKKYSVVFIGSDNSGKIIKANLVFNSVAPAWRPGDGAMYFDKNRKKYFAWLAAVPYAEVEGTIEIGRRKVEVSGSGYHDHNWGNVRLDKVLRQWYWGRARIGDYTLIFSEILTAKRYGNKIFPVFFLAKDRTILSVSKYDMDFEKSKWSVHPDGREYPAELNIRINQNDGSVFIRMFDSKIIEARSLIEGLSPFAQFIINIFANPYYFRFKGNVEMSVKLNGIIDHVTGSGIYEMMLLRGKHTVR